MVHRVAMTTPLLFTYLTTTTSVTQFHSKRVDVLGQVVSNSTGCPGDISTYENLRSQTSRELTVPQITEITYVGRKVIFLKRYFNQVFLF